MSDETVNTGQQEEGREKGVWVNIQYCVSGLDLYKCVRIYPVLEYLSEC